MYADIQIPGIAVLIFLCLLPVTAYMFGSWLGRYFLVLSPRKDKESMTFWQSYLLTWRDLYTPGAAIGVIFYVILLGLCLNRGDPWLHILKITGLYIGAGAVILPVIFLLATVAIVFGGMKRGWPFSNK